MRISWISKRECPKQKRKIRRQSYYLNMGAGRRKNPTAAAVSRSRGSRNVEDSHELSDGDRLLEQLENTRLLTDEGAWATAGQELRRRDPTRYVAILRVVEELCQIYRDPLGPVGADAYRVIPHGKDGDFD